MTTEQNIVNGIIEYLNEAQNQIEQLKLANEEELGEMEDGADESIKENKQGLIDYLEAASSDIDSCCSNLRNLL
jgi:hypothetical protein